MAAGKEGLPFYFAFDCTVQDAANGGGRPARVTIRLFFSPLQLPHAENIQSARLANEARHGALHDLLKRRNTLRLWVVYGISGPGLSAIRFTLQLRLPTRRRTRRASASLSLTPPSSTYSKVSFPTGAADKRGRPPSGPSVSVSA